MLLFAVADYFLQRGSIDVLKHTMSILPPKLESDGPESMRTQPSLQQNDGAVVTTSGSNTSGDVEEVSDEQEKMEADVDIMRGNVLEKVMNDEREHSNTLSILGADSEVQRLNIETQPAASEVPPADSEAQPDDSEVPLTDSKTQPGDSELSPADSEAQPADSEVPLADSKTQPGDSEVPPADSEVQRVNRDTHPADSEVPHACGTDIVLDQKLSGAGDISDLSNVHGDTAAPNEFEHMSASEQTVDSGDIVTGQSAIDDADVDVAAVTVLVSDIPRGLNEIVQMYLESERKGGGKILSFKYNEPTSSALVVFADNRGNCNNVVS